LATAGSGGDALGFVAAATDCGGALAAFVALESGVAMMAGVIECGSSRTGKTQKLLGRRFW